MGLSFERTVDYALIREIVTHRQIYRATLVSDSAPARADWRASEDPRLWYILPRLGDAPLGVLIFEPENAICWRAHLCMLPAAWGASGEICLGVVAWLAEHSPCRRIVAAVPAYNRLMHALARRIGMTEIGVNARSILRGGALHDQTIFGLSVPVSSEE